MDGNIQDMRNSKSFPLPYVTLSATAGFLINLNHFEELKMVIIIITIIVNS